MAVAVNLRTVDLRSKDFDSVSANRLVPRAAIDITKAVEQIIPLLEDVRTNGQDAIVKVTQERDGVDPRPIRVSSQELEQALSDLDPKLRKAIEESIERVFKVSRANLPQPTSVQLHRLHPTIRRSITSASVSRVSERIAPKRIDATMTAS